MAHNVDRFIGSIEFEAWEHGPVSREIWKVHRNKWSVPLAMPSCAAGYFAPAEQVLNDALAVYGCLPAWTLRQQSHLEKPWTDAWQSKDHHIPVDALRAHFQAQFRAGNVRVPKYLLAGWSLGLDGLAEPRFESLHELAEVVRSGS